MMDIYYLMREVRELRAAVQALQAEIDRLRNKSEGP